MIGVWVVEDGVIGRSSKPILFFDIHAILMVGIGTIAAALIASPPGRPR